MKRSLMAILLFATLLAPGFAMAAKPAKPQVQVIMVDDRKLEERVARLEKCVGMLITIMDKINARLEQAEAFVKNFI